MTPRERARQRDAEKAPERAAWLAIADDTFEDDANAAATSNLLAALQRQHPEGGHRDAR